MTRINEYRKYRFRAIVRRIAIFLISITVMLFLLIRTYNHVNKTMEEKKIILHQEWVNEQNDTLDSLLDDVVKNQGSVYLKEKIEIQRKYLEGISDSPAPESVRKLFEERILLLNE